MSRPTSAEVEAELEPALAAWRDGGGARPLVRALKRFLDGEGVPRNLPVADWGERLAGVLAELGSTSSRRALPEELLEPLAGWARAVARFARPGGAPVFSGATTWPGTAALLRDAARRFREPGLATVVELGTRRRGSARGRYASPPLPAFACDDRPLAMLRADWLPNGDLLAIDQREPADSRLELFGAGRAWLGPTWSSMSENPTGPAKPTRWVTGALADLAEWSFRSGDLRITCTAVLLRGRKLALLAEQVEGPMDSAGFSLTLPPGVTCERGPEGRSATLRADGVRVTPRVFPLALPATSYPTDRGAFRLEPGRLTLRQAVPPARSQRAWLPILVSWDSVRDKKPVTWRSLTVSERSQICPPEVAFAARVSWGRAESLVIYRSLGRIGNRAFLGHQTSSRFLIGRFTREGEVEPLLTVE